MEMSLEYIISRAAKDAGIDETGEVSIRELEYRDEVRKICEGNSCRCYGTTWACPPGVGTLEECQKRLESYNRMMVFSKIYRLEDSFDFAGMRSAMNDFKDVTEAFDRGLGRDFPPHMVLSNESCHRCEVCTYPDEPCRFPDKLYQAIEGYDLVVSVLATRAGIKYNNGPDTLTFFGALLWGRS